MGIRLTAAVRINKTFFTLAPVSGITTAAVAAPAVIRQTVQVPALYIYINTPPPPTRKRGRFQFIFIQIQTGRRAVRRRKYYCNFAIFTAIQFRILRNDFDRKLNCNIILLLTNVQDWPTDKNPFLVAYAQAFSTCSFRVQYTYTPKNNAIFIEFEFYSSALSSRGF